MSDDYADMRPWEYVVLALFAVAFIAACTAFAGLRSAWRWVTGAR